MRQPEIAAASSVAATATTGGDQPLQLPGWRAAPFDLRDSSGRADAERSARETDAGRQLQRCFPRWSRAFEHLRRTALMRLADNQPVDPNDADSWHSRDAHAQAVLRRHGLAQVARAAPADERDPRADRRPGACRPPGRPGLDDGDRARDAGSTTRCAARTRGCRSTSTTRACGHRATTSAARSAAGSASATSRPTTSRAGRSRTPTRSTPTTCAAGGSRRPPGWRSPTSSSRRSTASTGRSAMFVVPATAAAAGS